LAKTILQTSGSAPTVGVTVLYFPLGGDVNVRTTTEADHQIKFRTAGTLSALQITVSANATSANSTLRTRKNTANGGQTATILSGATGLFEDASGTDTIAATDLVNYSIVGGSLNTLTYRAVQTLFAATTNTVTKLILTATASSSYVVSTAYFMPLGGLVGNFPTTTESNANVRMRRAGTFKNLSVRGSVSSGTAVTVRVRKNSADSGMTITLPASVAITEDTTHTASCAVNDDFCFAVTTNSTTSSLNLLTISVEFETTDSSGLIVLGNTFSLDTQPFVKTTTSYDSIGGRILGSVSATTESFVQVKAKEAFTFENLECFCSISSGTASTITLRKGGADTTLVIPVGTVAGLFQDTTHTVTVAVADLIDLKIINSSVAGGAHDMELRWIAMFYTSGAAVSVPLYIQPVLNQWIGV
jgi:hypothetical protein